MADRVRIEAIVDRRGPRHGHCLASGYVPSRPYGRRVGQDLPSPDPVGVGRRGDCWFALGT